jgi:hypothetical protein
MKKHMAGSRNQSGYFIAEVPVALWFVLIVMLFPLLNLATTCLRTSFLWYAAHTATANAARAISYQTGINGQLPATTIAENSAVQTAAGFQGISVNSVQTAIIITDINNLKQTVSASRLKTPADPANFGYQIQVVVSGMANPLFFYPNNWFGRIPGLTAPMPITFSDRQFCEAPQGLNL